MAAPSKAPGQITSVFVRNYKSLAEAAVELPRFCVLVGPNGVGKSGLPAVSTTVSPEPGEVQSAKWSGENAPVPLDLKDRIMGLVPLDDGLDGGDAERAREVAAPRGPYRRRSPS